MVKRLLVTGLTGFVGAHVQQAMPRYPQWQLYPALPCDLLDDVSLNALLDSGLPDAVIHLAGQTHVPTAFRDPAKTLQVNVIGTLNLLQALKRAGFMGTFLLVSSGDVYGQVDTADLPIGESHAPDPRNPYAVSKLSAEFLCLQWGVTEKWRVLVARPFNHIGSGQREDFVIPSVAKQLACIRLGLQSPAIEVGDIDVSRDFLDVRDVIDAYMQLLTSGHGGNIYNVCSGKERTVRSIIETLGLLADVEFELVQDPARLRPSDQQRVVGCSLKLQEHTGWKPAISMEDCLQSVLSDWAERVV